MRVRNDAFVGNLFRSARLFSEGWRCASTVVFSPRLDYTLVRGACSASQSLSLQLTDGWITRSSVSYVVASVLLQGTDPHAEQTRRISKMATTTVDSGSATHRGLMGDLYGNVDATNWGTVKDRLQRVLDGDDRFKHVTTDVSVGPEPEQSEFTRTLGGSTVPDVATFRTQHRNYRHDVDDLDQALAQARNILFVCLGEATFARIADKSTHELWAALDKDLGAASHDFARSEKLDALFQYHQYQAYVDGDLLNPWFIAL
ncbi:hypothetical protein MVLG_04374 [Microbotryum lychnidis-dioicae p1A1 Lamole]|uniref:Uncharacterized protein n=1 Tax=Microbotryum lychnidis-dioicae (strain p1A1 Lamole / MvSl-1064) TaxID=683840 RepID=U5HB12_USTV1|nr:hypothetical protein MVLG_04374 [Microbotryum lychnidis-dioicae p1A1 Lamole]|eukprot:KDE05239.1 hypothetical protein MVLG_04374 [Microbotryum lychnidis-dioicae p1A1 Lamole]